MSGVKPAFCGSNKLAKPNPICIPAISPAISIAEKIRRIENPIISPATICCASTNSPAAEAHDRAGLERLLRYCARPAFARVRLREIDAEHLVHESVKPGPGGGVSLVLTPMELLDRLAALIPPPCQHRHRYVGVLAPNAPLRAVVTALAQPEAEARLATPEVQSVVGDDDMDEPLHRKAARLVWAMLIARIYEVFPLVCPRCGGQMRIIAFITDGAAIREILAHLGGAVASCRHADRPCGKCRAPNPASSIPNFNWHRTTSSISGLPGDRGKDRRARSPAWRNSRLRLCKRQEKPLPQPQAIQWTPAWGFQITLSPFP